MEISLERTAELLSNNSNIVITAHVHPDGDSLGSMLALDKCLSSMGKNVQLILDDAVPDMYDFLPGTCKIIKPNSQKIKADLLVVLDASDIERIGHVRAAVDAPVLNIDHHISNTKFADYLFLDSDAAATGEILFKLFKHMNTTIDPDIATSLYTAIATDCGFFRYANTSSNTMRYCAELIDFGAKPNLISEALEARPLAAITNLSKMLDTLELFFDGKVAAITVLPEMLTDNDNTEGVINYPRIIEGVEIAIMFKFVEDGICRISLRSARVDVSQLALSFGGGGHARAAGCTVSGTVAEVKEKVIGAVIEHLQADYYG
ncbi:DHH family phosphoesterase [Dendrosporobacter sp. 1207_IL3150]|uniref:DHH family phosphoesterase n=1 Tax=Dendrosporobacter sp. 1207_IL3150 TaxID=3084054 RepID=UPI002FDB5B30